MLNIGICTRERPKMLEALLESLCVSIARAGVDVAIILVENGPPGGAKTVADGFADRLNIAFSNEERLGLVYARNAVVRQFLAGPHDWIALVDDDETVAPDWLATLLKARADFPDTDMFVGPTFRIYDASAPRILREMRQKRYRYGQKKFGSGTNNCFMHRRNFDDGEKLHLFDLAYNLSGGEDYDLFRRIKARGLVCRYIMAARTYEAVPDSRQSLKFQLSKWRHQSHCRGRVYIGLHGEIAGRLLVLFEMTRDIARIIVFSLAGSVALVFSESRGLALLGLAMRSFAALSGRPLALWKRLGDSYASVQGH
tara:strand:+ start:1118 stop:2053 length:936 start_codon:yes stop_codon:yes gene_type:complete